MNLQINVLCEKLQPTKVKYLHLYSENTYIKSAKLITGHQTSFQPDVLYVGRVSDLPEDMPENSKLNLLCVEDSNIPAVYTLNKCCNLILVEEKTDVSELFNAVQDILMDSYFIMQSSAALFNTIIRGKGLQYIMEIGSGLLGNPIMMGDSNHRLLAYSKDDNIDDPSWIEFRDKGYCTYEYTTKYGFEKWVEKAIQSKLPIIGDLGAISKKRRIFAKIVIDGTIVGHLAVLENNKPLTQRDIEITSYICDVIAAEMQKNSHFRNTRSVMLENLVIDLLGGQALSEEETREKIKYLHWKPKEKLYLLAIKYNSYESTFSLIPFIRDTLGEMMEGEKAYFYDNHIMFIIGCSKERQLKSSDFERLISFLRVHGLCAGLSQGFDRITDLQKYYKQCLSSMALGSRIDKNIVLYMYADYSIYHLIDICSAQHDINDFCHPAILKLQAYDARNKSDYVRTLYTYIINARNLISTADVLFIHRNTLSYRIAKIQEITKIELENDDEMMKLFISYKILEYSGKLK